MFSISNNSDSQHPALPPRDQNASKKPIKSYLSSERYKPELQFALASPTPSPSSVFYQKTPKITPSISPLHALETPKITTATAKDNTPLNNHNFYGNNNSNSHNASSGNSNINPTSPIIMQPARPAFTQPQPSQPASTQPTSQPIINHMDMPIPTDVNPINYQPIVATTNNSAPSSYSNHHTPTVNVTSPDNHHQPPQYSLHNPDPIVLPLAQQQHYNSAPAVIPVAPPNPMYQNQQNGSNSSSSSYFPPQQQQQQQSYPYQPIRQSTSSPPVSLPLNSNAMYQHSNYSQQQQQQQHLPTQQPQYSFNSVYQSTPPPQQQSQQSQQPPPPPPQQRQQHYQSTKPPLASASSSSGFQLPPMPAFVSSSTTTAAASKSQPQKQNSTLALSNPYYKKQDDQKKPQFSNSTISLKPDEEQPNEHSDEEDDWDNIKSKKSTYRPPTPIAVAVSDHSEDDDDKESEIDYSDMIYDRRNESNEEKQVVEDQQGEEKEQEEEEEEEEEGDWEDTAIDPFDDDFAVHVPKGSTATSATVVGDFRKKKSSSTVTSLTPSLQILDPTILPTTTTTSPPPLEEKIAVEKRKPKQDKIEELVEDNTPRQYVEKESEDIEPRPITPHVRQPSMGSFIPPSSTSATSSSGSFYQPLQAQHQHQHLQNSYYNRPQSTPLIELDLPEDESSKVYPTNILKAGAPPPPMSANNPYVKKQGSK